MKKLISVVVLMLVVLMGVICVGCGELKLDLSVELQVRQTYFDDLKQEDGWDALDFEDVYVVKYYGTFNNCVVVMMWTKTRALFMETYYDTIDGITIAYAHTNQRISVWRDDKFYDLPDAYSQGFLNKANIKKIAAVHADR